MIGQNDGGANDFYRIPTEVRDMDALKRYLKLNSVDLLDWGKIRELQTGRKFPDWVEDVDTLNEWLGDSFYLGNILKTFWLHRGKRHNGTNEVRELKKRDHYIKRLKERR